MLLFKANLYKFFMFLFIEKYGGTCTQENKHVKDKVFSAY